MTATPNAFAHSPQDAMTSADDLVLICQRCREAVGTISRSHAGEDGSLVCPRCLSTFRMRRGVWNGLTAEREAHFSSFIREYESIRAAEGRGSDDPAFYLALPERDISGKNEAQWRIRSRTYECLDRRVLAPITERIARAADVLDLGAGNGWLSYRLALLGHRPVAVDLLENEFDGLGAAKHFRARIPGLFPRVRTAFEALPFHDGQFDVAVFNASFHYSENYERTLGEALRCLRRPGWLVIADTAWYSHESSGEAMLKERASAFMARFGTPSNALQSLEFLTDTRLEALARTFRLQWQRFEPIYGIRWRMRPLVAKLRGRREPSKFRIYVAEVIR